MATFSGTHVADSLATPGWGSRNTVHGQVSVTFWAADKLAYTLRLTRPNGVQLEAPIGAAPANYLTLVLHPDEVLDVECRSATVSNINVMVE